MEKQSLIFSLPSFLDNLIGYRNRGINMVWFWVLLSSSLFIFCDSLSAYWGKTGDFRSLILVILFSPFGYILFGYLNQKMSLGTAGALVNLIIVSGALVVGSLFFHEQITFTQGLGIVCAMIAIALITQ